MAAEVMQEVQRWRLRSMSGDIKPTTVDTRGLVDSDLLRWSACLSRAAAAVDAAASVARDPWALQAIKEADKNLLADYAVLESRMRAERDALRAERDALRAERVSEEERTRQLNSQASDLEARIAATVARTAEIEAQIARVLK
jgi:chromosome segregation ATPase